MTTSSMNIVFTSTPSSTVTSDSAVLKHASSKRFDLTLMIAFLREITGIRTPKSGWNKLPDTNDRSTESDIARIKYYRNQVAHAASCTINTHDFQKRWEDLSEAIIRIGGEGFKSETSALLSAALDSSYQDLYLELRAMKKDIIPSNIQFVMDVKIQSMATEDKTATKYVTDAVDQYGVVMVTGPPGSGKTATVNHIALQLQEKGYRICPVVSTNEIVEYWMPEVPQVFVFNDHFGVHDINQSELQQWMNNQERLNICFQYSNMKILATVRSHIIKDQQFSENVLSSTDLQIKSLVNDDIVLTDDERLQIFNAHVNINKRDDLKVMGVEIQNFTISCFPLLCKLYTSDRESKFSDKDFFKKPLSVISKDLDKFKINDPVHYFCLLYCMINDNNLVTDILSINEESKKVKKARKILLEKCKLSTTLSREEIRSKMDTLLNTYLKLEGNCYQFIHDIIHDAVIQHVNNLPIDWKPIILQYCGSKFLNERICLSYISCSHEGAHLSVNSDLESTWGRRILNDMVDYHSSWNYMVNNHSLYNEKSDTLLVQSFQCIDQTQLENIIKRSHPCRDLSPYFDAFSKIGKFYDPTSFVTDVTLLHLLICLGLKNCVKSILEKKKQILHQMNLLLVASIMDKRDIAEMLLLNGWNANICYEGEASILLLSSLFGHKAISELLLKHKANIEKCDKYGQSPLIISSVLGHVEIVKLLLEHKADKDKCDEYGRSPLFISSKNGHVEIVKLLLEHKADKDKCNMFGLSPLFISSVPGHVEIVKLLLEHKADKDKCNKYGRSPLFISSENGHVEIVKLLLEHKADKDKCDEYGRSPLSISSRNGHVEIVKLLLEHKADKDKCDDEGQSPLFISSENGHVEIVKLLLEHKADKDKCNMFGLSPLSISSVLGHVEIVKLLLEHKADKDQCDKYDQSPLFISSENGHVEIVKLLLEHKADKDQCDKYDQSPLFISSENGHVEIVKLLLEHKADKDKCDECGLSPLFISSENGHVEIVKLLLEHKADKDKCNMFGLSPLFISSNIKLTKINVTMKGQSPLFISSENGHVEIVKLLLEHKADKDQCNKYGQSPLFISSRNGHAEIVKLLLEHKADKDQCDMFGMSPLIISSKKGHVDVVKLLLEHKADKDN
ncbi:hypothetical protein KUTeg_005547 [Tegillarca granosa]|uniref:DZIP3-like HEPN domain-containing protein n=1 Tax=Tegillarca granosa TaxID=220873 RepID=A0ABQ9FK19_TEGGR|nr:hypothetical protein KUTeg_005547 [Tegillarca granosa]